MRGRSLFRHQLILALKRVYYVGRGEPFSIQGHKLRYVPGTRPTRLYYADSQDDWVARYDALALRVLSETLSEGDTAIDVSAHCGQYAIIMAALCGSAGCVVAFEPDPHARQVLARNIRLNSHITPPRVESLAVSATKGEGILYSRGGNANSSLAPILVSSSETDIEKIAVRTSLFGRLPQRSSATSLGKDRYRGSRDRYLEGRAAASCQRVRNNMRIAPVCLG